MEYVLNKERDADVFVISDGENGKDDTENFSDPFFEAELASFG